MKIGGFIYILSLTMLFSACSMVTKLYKTPAKSLQPTDIGYSGADEVMFYYTEGVKHLALGGDTELIKKLLLKAIKLDSTHSPSLYHLAHIYSKSDLQKAIDYGQRAMSIDTTNIWIKSMLAQLLISAKNYDKAENLYEDLVTEQPNEPSNYRILAALYHQNNQPFTAIVVLDSAETKLGRIESLSSYKSLLLRELKMFDKAIQETKSLIVSYPYNYENYLTLAELYAETRKDSLANANYQKALSINPNAINVLLSLSNYYRATGNENQLITTIKRIFLTDQLEVEQLIEVYNELITDNSFHRRNIFRLTDLTSTLIIKFPNNPKILKLYTNNLISQGGLDETLRLYKAQIKEDSTSMDYFHTIIDIEAYKKNIDSVEKYSTMALSQHPENTDLILRRAGIFTYLKDYTKAWHEYDLALKHAETDSISSYIKGAIGDMHHQLGNKKKGYKQYRKALKLDPDNSLVLNNYAYFLSEDNIELDRALEMAEHLIELTSGNATYLDTYGWILHKLGDNKQAKKVIQQAISLDTTNNDEILLHYGDVCHALGEDFMAKIYWRKALEAGYKKEEIEKRFEILNKK